MSIKRNLDRRILEEEHSRHFIKTTDFSTRFYDRQLSDIAIGQAPAHSYCLRIHEGRTRMPLIYDYLDTLLRKEKVPLPQRETKAWPPPEAPVS